MPCEVMRASCCALNPPSGSPEIVNSLCGPPKRQIARPDRSIFVISPTFRHETASSAALFAALEKANVVCSLRHDREGRDYLRFSPHFYNTEVEIDSAIRVLREAL